MWTPMTDARLREIAAREWGPNRQESSTMAEELLALRQAIRDIARYSSDVSVESHFPDLAAALARAAKAVEPVNA